MASQNPGDKSGELSVRTQDLLEEASQDEDDQVGDDDDDDLSEQMSYDGNDHSASHNDVSALGALESDGDDDDLMFFDEGADEDGTSEGSEGEESQGSEDEESQNESSSEDGDGDGDAARLEDYRNVHDAHSTLQDLIDVYSTRNQVSIEQYERSLQQLHTKWEAVLDQAVYDREQQLDSAEQERQEMMLHIEELKQAHEDELEESKETVMEQSQKIILEEMKLNADLDLNLVKSEETYEYDIQKAVELSQIEMNEEFEIALEGMKTAQDEMKVRYEKLIKDAKIRVRDEVEFEFKGKYENEMMSFKETYDEMKVQVLDQTMHIQSLEMKSGKNLERDGLIASLENELKVLRKAMEEAKMQHGKQIEQLQKSHEKEKESLQKVSANMITPESLQVAVKKAKDQTRKDMTEEFDIVLSGLKNSQLELATRYEELVKDAEIRVRHEVYAEAKKDADRKISAFKMQYDEITKEVLEMALQIEKLEMDNGSKASEIEELNESAESHESLIEQLTSEIEQLNVSVESHETLVEDLQTEVGSKNTEIARMQAELKGKNNQIMEKKNLLAAKEEEIKVSVTTHQDESNMSKEKNYVIKELRDEIKTKEAGIKDLVEEIDTAKMKISGFTAEFESKDNLIKTKDNTIKDLSAIIVAKDKVIQSKESESSNSAKLEIRNTVELNQQKMKKQFEIALTKEHRVQEEMKVRYEKLIEDTKIRVRDEAGSEIKEQYENKMTSFKESSESQKVAERDGVVSSLENELKVLRLVMEETKTHHEKQVQLMQIAHEKEKSSLQKGLNGSVAKATDEIREDIEKENNSKPKDSLIQIHDSAKNENGDTAGTREVHVDTALKHLHVVAENDVTPKAGIGARDKVFDDTKVENSPKINTGEDPISPLGMTSPLASPDFTNKKRRVVSSGIRTPLRIPKTVDTRKKQPRESVKKASSTSNKRNPSRVRLDARSHKTAPATPNTRRVSKRPSRAEPGGSSHKSPVTPITRSVSKRNPSYARTSTKSSSSRARTLERSAASTSKK